MLRPSCLSQPANTNSCAPVTPAQSSLPGSARAKATRSPSEATVIPAGTEMAISVFEKRVIGTRSLGLYGRLSCRKGCAVNDDDGVDGDKAVAAGTVIDDDRLPPALREPVRQQAGADIGSAARAKGQNETDRTGRPIGRC